MKKIVLLAFTMLIILFISVKSYAGDIPESALNYDDSRVYLGEVKEKTDKYIIVIQRSNIKGEFTQNREIKYKNKYENHYNHINSGQTYLFVDFMGYEENNTEIEDNNVYSFDLKDFDLEDISKTKLLIDNIFDTSDVAVRMQEYMDNKDFEKAEKERIERKGTEKEKLFYSKDEKIEEDKKSIENVENQKDNSENKEDDKIKKEENKFPISIGFLIIIVIVLATIFLKYKNK